MGVDITKAKQLSRETDRGDGKVFVNPRPGMWDVEVWLMHRQGARTHNASIKNGSIELQEVQEGMAPNDPFLGVPQDVWQLIIDAATESTPPVKKERVEAELDATKRHLADMRRLVFDSPHQGHEEPEDKAFSKN